MRRYLFGTVRVLVAVLLLSLETRTGAYVILRQIRISVINTVYNSMAYKQ